jgi:uncharacterized protein
MAKPSGSACNLDCTYCFYLEKEKLYPETKRPRMSHDVLAAYIRQTIAGQPGPAVSFAWQGGEPTLMGLDFFREAVALQKQLCPDGWTISNSIQTNGVLLNDAWCAFLKAEGFLVGLSIDGPRALHDRYRVDKGGHPTFDRVMKAMATLRQHGVTFNTLTVVNREVSAHPLEVYRFLKEAGSTFMQFIPLVERESPDGELAGPPTHGADDAAEAVTSWSVLPDDFGRFLSAIFDEWSCNDIGEIHVQIFEVMVGVWLGHPATLCLYSERCGRAMVVEHNGDVYACDHFVYPEYLLGNVVQDDMRGLVESPQQVQFGADKETTLPRQCQECPVRFACHGECPKRRFLKTADGEPGLNYLCAGYLRFLKHIDEPIRFITRRLQAGRDADTVMPELRRQRAALAAAGRHRPCSCGSGKKWKKCCGRGR